MANRIKQRGEKEFGKVRGNSWRLKGEKGIGKVRRRG